MKKLFLCSVFATISLTTHAEVPNGTYTELAKFKSTQNEGLPENYIQNFPTTVLNMMLTNEKNFLSSHENVCSDSLDIQYIKRITDTDNMAVAEFESSILKIEVSKCFENTTPSRLMQVTASPEFKKKAISSIKSSKFDGTTYCEITSAAFVGDSSYCYKIKTDDSNDRYLKTVSFNDWNDSDTKYGVKVFFRSGYSTARQIQNHTVYHLVTYIRGPKINSLIKMLSKPFIVKTQEDSFSILKEELK